MKDKTKKRRTRYERIDLQPNADLRASIDFYVEGNEWKIHSLIPVYVKDANGVRLMGYMQKVIDETKDKDGNERK